MAAKQSPDDTLRPENSEEDGQIKPRTPKRQVSAAVVATSLICRAVEKAIVEIASSRGAVTVENVVDASRTVMKVCERQTQKSCYQLTNLIRLDEEKAKSTSTKKELSAVDKRTKLLEEDILFLDILQLALSKNKFQRGAKQENNKAAIALPLKQIKVLGQGGFGIVWQGVDRNGVNVAVKEVKRHGIEEKSLREEIRLLGKLSHDNIVKYYGFVGDKHAYYMFMELMEGSIKDKMVSCGRPISHEMAQKYTRDLLAGLIYLHGKGVIHRDIKCANVLLDSNDTAKLADMGLSKIHSEETQLQAVGSGTGTVSWMSPEVVDKREAGKRADVWSVGCTIYEMITSKPPFYDRFLFLLVLRLPIKVSSTEHRKLVSEQQNLSPSLRDLLLKIFVNVEERPFAEEAATHCWLTTRT